MTPISADATASREAARGKSDGRFGAQTRTSPEVSLGQVSEECCSCARDAEGNVTTKSLCPTHADIDPCETFSRVTGRRRKGRIRRGVCTNCGWREARGTRG